MFNHSYIYSCMHPKPLKDKRLWPCNTQIVPNTTGRSRQGRRYMTLMLKLEGCKKKTSLKDHVVEVEEKMIMKEEHSKLENSYYLPQSYFQVFPPRTVLCSRPILPLRNHPEILLCNFRYLLCQKLSGAELFWCSKGYIP